ncbi:hypothetical protein GH714_037795 [Hevea brasiliensis]|uniref:HAT C-terminal dimerisation domain-containing protein n=1 Tax=Hevea brasiliensis TaxID=3981 RepID=A0A6A6LR93_HEVBR|nr:hypothetical protein GH714_037795 [Hevea brasiliensis]
MKDRVKYDKVRRMVEEVEKSGVSSSLKNSTICTMLKPIVAKANPIASAFSMMERDAVDLKVMRGLCANGIPFNVLRNPQFCEMITAINNAPKGYKAPSYEKARTILLDECKRDVEKDLTMIKDTWYTQGVSIVSNGWSNKHRPLINVIAANSRGAMFIEALATTIVLKSWKEWTKNGDEKMKTMGALVAETISDDEFWEEVENIVAITKPLYLLIKFSDGESPKLGEIYEKMDSMLGELKDIMTNNKYKDSYEQMEAIVVERWAKMNIPMHCLGFALTPRFYDHHYLETPAPGGVPRKAPNLDKEVVLGVMDDFERIAENGAKQKLLREQFVIFHMKKGIYSMPAAQIDAVTMDSIDWWSTYGSETPELAEVAKKVLSQPISSSSAERNWSTYSYIHNVKRNRLNCTRADKLVFIHSNIRLQSRFFESYVTGPHKRWDMDPENSYLEDSAVKLEDMGWRSLDDDNDFDVTETIEEDEDNYTKNKGKKQRKN